MVHAARGAGISIRRSVTRVQAGEHALRADAVRRRVRQRRARCRGGRDRPVRLHAAGVRRRRAGARLARVERAGDGDVRKKSVAVVGLGQSALEGAAIAHEAGARVEVIGREPGIVWLGDWSDVHPNGGATAATVPSVEKPAKETWRARTGLHWRRAPTGVGGRFSSWLGAAPDVLRVLPRGVRGSVTSRCLLPAGAEWLPSRLREVQDQPLASRCVRTRGGRAGAAVPRRRVRAWCGSRTAWDRLQGRRRALPVPERRAGRELADQRTARRCCPGGSSHRLRGFTSSGRRRSRALAR